MCSRTILNALEKRFIVKLMDVPAAGIIVETVVLRTFCMGDTVNSGCWNGKIKKYGYSFHIFHLIIKV
jgi:hypothetical protein